MFLELRSGQCVCGKVSKAPLHLQGPLGCAVPSGGYLTLVWSPLHASGGRGQPRL